MTTTAAASEEKENSKFWKTAFIIFVAIILIIAVIVTAGYFAARWKSEQEKKKKDEKRKRLEEIDAKLAVLKLKLAQIKKQERIILIGCRVGIGALLIALNSWYAVAYDLPFTIHTICQELTEVNGALILVYSFF